MRKSKISVKIKKSIAFILICFLVFIPIITADYIIKTKGHVCVDVCHKTNHVFDPTLETKTNNILVHCDFYNEHNHEKNCPICKTIIIFQQLCHIIKIGFSMYLFMLLMTNGLMLISKHRVNIVLLLDTLVKKKILMLN